ncbi:RNase A-like domain-containing protein [Pantoea sp. CCBC3-3-1]|uniref:RNase A-like domain-containing protein n=1 Tax=Pantoea sp. CCBC3-3-1 TaxID=2490851 RepID=UPI0011BD756F|nr:RNase A-like domain-containing protein [Pantoea sp. CCBC3-3-1]
MDNNDGIKIILSPVHLAALLSDKSVSEGETLSNRLYGGLGLAGGIIEMFGAGAMCIAPEPTMLTKAGCVIVGTHSLDTVQASLRQVWTGRNTDTDTYNSAVSLAESLGADRKAAMKVGFTVDLAIPLVFSLAIGAQRVIAIQSGRLKLSAHEALPGSRAGGHTIDKHIGKTSEELLARLKASPRLTQSSSFQSMRDAEALISKVLRDNKNQIAVLTKNVPSGQNLKMVFDRNFAKQTGISVSRGEKEAKACYQVRIILKFESWHGKPYFILTAFPMV